MKLVILSLSIQNLLRKFFKFKIKISGFESRSPRHVETRDFDRPREGQKGSGEGQIGRGRQAVRLLHFRISAKIWRSTNSLAFFFQTKI